MFKGDGQRKRRRIAELAGLKCVTDSALAAILHRLNDQHDEELPMVHRTTIARAVEADACTETVYGPLLAVK